MRNFAKSCVVFAAASLMGTSVAIAEEKAQSLDQLLNLIKSSKLAESKEHRQREAVFKREKSKQQSLLAKAKAEKARLEALSQQKEKEYEKQELEVNAKRKQLDERLGSLKELFGHLTTVAGDLRSTLQDSVTSAQYPGRGDFIDGLIAKMNSNTQLPKMDEIERVWYELQREIIEGGKVVKFSTTVTLPDGNKQVQDVVRVGVHNLVSNGKYLAYNGETGSVSELARQPGGSFLGQASDLQNATSGITRFGIDPTGPQGGSFLKALINSPNIIERWHQGGYVGYFITFVFALAIVLGLVRIIVLAGMTGNVSKQLKASKANPNNPLGRVLKVAEDNKSSDVESLELKLAEAILKERPGIERGLSWLKLVAMLGPLLGLLGTVTGMIMTFQAITIFGAGDPKAMAGGISGALVTTVLGLLVAIPITLLHTYVGGKAKKLLHILEEQSAGIIAENAEK